MEKQKQSIVFKEELYEYKFIFVNFGKTIILAGNNFNPIKYLQKSKKRGMLVSKKPIRINQLDYEIKGMTS